MKLTDEQLAVVEWAKNPTQNAMLRAYAGSGKSSTIREAVKIWHTQGWNGLIVSFGKSIASEMNAKLKEIGVHKEIARTMHSIGLEIIRYNINRVKVNDFKVNEVAKWLLDRGKLPFRDTNDPRFKNAVTVARELKSYGGEFFWMDEQFIEDFCAEEGYDRRRIEPALQIIEELATPRWEDMVDFDDMILWPIYKRVNGEKMTIPARLTQNDFLCVDEVQDWSQEQRELALSLRNDNTVVLAAGDPEQCIFSFAGAYYEHYDEIKQRLNAIEMPLSITFRCPRQIAKWANAYVPMKTAKNEEGCIQSLEYEDFLQAVTHKDLVYARYSGEIIEAGMRLMRIGKPVHIPGRKIHKQIKRLFERYKGIEGDHLITALQNEYHNLEKNAPRTRAVKAQMEVIQTAIYLIRIEIVKTQQELLDALKRLTERNEPGDILVQSVHQVKGKEADRCFYINGHAPAYAKSSKDEDEEKRIHYVGITRSKRDLFLVLPPKKIKELE